MMNLSHPQQLKHLTCCSWHQPERPQVSEAAHHWEVRKRMVVKSGGSLAYCSSYSNGEEPLEVDGANGGGGQPAVIFHVALVVALVVATQNTGGLPGTPRKPRATVRPLE